MDTAQYLEYFALNGWATSDSIEAADLVVVMSCGFSGEFEEASIRLIEAADRRRRPGSQMVIVGCLAGIDPDRLKRLFDARLVSREERASMDDLIQARVPLADVKDPNIIEPYIARAARHFSEREHLPAMTPSRALVSRLDRGAGRLLSGITSRGQGEPPVPPRVWSLRVARGCMGECAYCAIRFSTGPLCSKPLAEVVAEFDEGLDAGFTEFRLIAGDLGCYGQDIGTNIYELLDALMQRRQDFRLDLLDFDPKWFILYHKELVELFARNQSRIKRVEIPVQSGSERVLARMLRGHTAGDAREALCALRAACPELLISTHVLIGFPGETDDDFDDTLALVKAVRFSHIADYDYEDRPRTLASTMPNKVPKHVVRARGTRLRRETGGNWLALRHYLRGWGLGG